MALPRESMVIIPRAVTTTCTETIACDPIDFNTSYLVPISGEMCGESGDGKPTGLTLADKETTEATLGPKFHRARRWT